MCDPFAAVHYSGLGFRRISPGVSGVTCSAQSRPSPSMQSLRQSNPRAPPARVRRSCRIRAQPLSRTSNKHKEVLSRVPRAASTGRTKRFAPHRDRRKKDIRHSGKSSVRWRTSHLQRANSSLWKTLSRGNDHPVGPKSLIALSKYFLKNVHLHL